MKTIREVIQFGGSLESIVRELEARDKERDARRDEERIALEKTVERQRAELAIHRCKAAGEYWVWQGDGDDLGSLTCPIVIHPDDMRKRDAAERERVKAVLKDILPPSALSDSLPERIYPQPNSDPVKLKAGYYWYREHGMEGWLGASWIYDFTPKASVEYRPWNDPPSEVTGKVAPPDASRVGEFNVHTTTGIMRITASSQEQAERIAKHDGHTLPTYE